MPRKTWSRLFWLPSSQLALILQTISVNPTFAQDSDDCVPPPLAFPIANVSLPSGDIRRGVKVRVGEPETEYSFLPSCKPAPIAKCDTFRGGLYDPEKSDTDGSLDSDFESQPDRFDRKTYEFFTDTISLGENGSLKDYPLAKPLDASRWDLQGYVPQHILGMDSGSTFLQALVDGGHIASKSWGFYWGLDGRGSREQSEGSFVLGGYDKAKTYGDGYTEDLEPSEGCPTGMQVVIRDMTLNFANGTDTSIFPGNSGGQGLIACIDPAVPVLMDLPLEPYFLNWQFATGWALENGRSTGIDYWNVLLSQNKQFGFDGELTFQFGSDFRVVIPNNNLVVPDRSFSDDGKIYANDTQSVLRINALQDTNSRSLPRLGRYFLSMVHVLYNDGAKQFTMWEANPTSTTDLVAINEKGDVVESSFCTEEATSTPTAGAGSKGPPVSDGPPDSEDPPDSKETEIPDNVKAQSKGLSSGIIAGIAIGGAVVILAILTAMWFWRSRKLAKAKAAEAAQRAYIPTVSETDSKSPECSSDIGYPSQGYPHFIPQEMPAIYKPPPPAEMEG
ncbi:hypothetical protein ACO1O0_004850 [Amphichorda felina]